MITCCITNTDDSTLSHFLKWKEESPSSEKELWALCEEELVLMEEEKPRRRDGKEGKMVNDRMFVSSQNGSSSTVHPPSGYRR